MITRHGPNEGMRRNGILELLKKPVEKKLALIP